ncbi:hypothetical protein AVEN_129738-1 [Araneus ventricosus]|uniref:Uncharacterized protein n=1 Tax=Araneus ventricosus TaxID=182803 RepID=A0A4Y2JAC0_ARAVE|nr:hypothetical protein AVEN_129738-1 [Araneus ventricosus]
MASTIALSVEQLTSSQYVEVSKGIYSFQHLRKARKEFRANNPNEIVLDIISRPVSRGPRWPSGKASASGRRDPDSKPDCTEDPPCMWACCTLNNSEVAKRPPACMLRRFGEMVPAQVSSSSSDNGSKLRTKVSIVEVYEKVDRRTLPHVAVNPERKLHVSS